jgi:hypothetical protein
MTDATMPMTADAAALGCPFHHGAAVVEVQRSRADLFMRRLLRVPERPAGVTAASAVSAFRRSMVISTVRCTLTYLVFPFVLPALGLVTETGVVLGMVIGVLAITCDVFTIRRFFVADHRWRWPFSTVAFCVICMLAVLLVQDIVHVLT